VIFPKSSLYAIWAVRDGADHDALSYSQGGDPRQEAGTLFAILTQVGAIVSLPNPQGVMQPVIFSKSSLKTSLAVRDGADDGALSYSQGVDPRQEAKTLFAVLNKVGTIVSRPLDHIWREKSGG